jgi:hypothetical protein
MTMPRLLLFLILPAIVGCSGSRESTSTNQPPDPGENLRVHESGFRPSDYEPEPEAATPGHGVRIFAPGDTTATTPMVELQEMVQGYRVQILSTASIDSANAQLREAAEAFPNEWYYLEYDAPTYKVRAGNFLTKYEADRFAKQLIERGYKTAWTVPQRVYKGPPPPPPR